MREDPHSVRVLPHDLTAERAVLGACLVDPLQIDRLASSLGVEAFYRSAHQKVYQVLVDLADQGREIDLVTLRSALESRGWLEEVGGPAYIAALVDGVPKSTNADAYAAIIREKKAFRTLIDVGEQIVSRAYQAAEPSSEALRWAEDSVSLLQGAEAGRAPSSLLGAAGRLYADLDRRRVHAGELIGIDTGFETLNRMTHGWQPGQLAILAAVTSAGKSALSLNMAQAAAKGGKRVLFFSLEMTRQELERRLLSSVSQVMHSRIIQGNLNPIEGAQIAAALEVIDGWDLAFVDTPSLTTLDIRRTCRAFQKVGGLDLVVVDYVQLVEATTTRRGSTRAEDVADIARHLKLLAGELGVPILALSQLNRGADENRPPELRDLRESGALEQHANFVGFIHPLERHSDPAEPIVCKFIVRKQRNGPTGAFVMTFDRMISEFREGGVEPVSVSRPTKPQKKFWEGKKGRDSS